MSRPRVQPAGSDVSVEKQGGDLESRLLRKCEWLTNPGLLRGIWLFAVLWFASSGAMVAQDQCSHPYYWQATAGSSPAPNNCFGSSGFRCYKAPESSGSFRLEDPGCDPNTTGCVVHLVVPLEFPGLQQMVAEDGLFSAPTPRVYWFEQASAPPCPGSPPDCSPTVPSSVCGIGGLRLNADFLDTWVEKPGVTCQNAASMNDMYSLRAIVCWATGNACREETVVEDLVFGGQQLAAQIGCPPPPPPKRCPQDASCESCKGTGQAGADVEGGGAGASPGGSAPGEGFSYAAGGAGGDDTPGSRQSKGFTSTTGLGRFWMHPWAERIVPDPDDSHVWLITRWATFREFSNLVSGVYQTVGPSDEYRLLQRTAAGWELHDLDGRVQSFDNLGVWTGTVDRHGNAITPTYVGGVLDEVSLPDGRHLEFTYASGTLATITEWGVGNGASRTWTYTWSGEDLMQIDQPDGRSWSFQYTDVRHAGYMTRMTLLGDDLPRSQRIEGAWEYDDDGNVVHLWQGAADKDDALAVGRWDLAFDDPVNPTQTLITDPLGDVATYDLARDDGSTKAKITRIEGDCPSCGLSPNAVLEYTDSAHPLRRTAEIDGEGNRTEYTYGIRGQVLTQTEAAGTALQRTTTWTYHPTWPGLVALIERPSTTGMAGDQRETEWTYDPVAGTVSPRTERGFEDTIVGGPSFSLDTVFTYNTAGQALTIDPPGYGTADLTSMTYDPARGNLVVSTRVDPLIGTTSFDYDPLNRRVGTTDPNGILGETRYDLGNRVTDLIQRSSDTAAVGDPILAADLHTHYEYTPLGDLLRTTLPEGNLIEYAYDAAGRLVSIERKPDALTPRERTFYTLDPAGNRIREELQRWDSGLLSWVTESQTDYLHSSRCHLDKMVYPDGATTEYAYDCNNNLERVWDANHPSLGGTAPPTTEYAYDALDRLTTVTQPWGGVGGGTTVTSYSYDEQDHLVSVTDAEGNATTYRYSDRDLLTEEVSPVSGTTTHIYNEHSELVSTTDARGITTSRTVDELDRLTGVDYPTDSLDVTYVYDDPLVSFSLGRLTAISRDGDSTDYTYDRFGRVLQDGALLYAYDENGNTAEISYPSGVMAVYGYDFANRQSSLLLREPGQADVSLVSGATYKPFGPLSGLTFGNGLVESRSFDQRYFPQGFDVAGSSTVFDWDYATDDIGNVTSITDALDASMSRTYAYQDYQYFLTSSTAPGGDQAWTYDKIGNRLTEVEEGEPTPFVYNYEPGVSGNTARLSSIAPVPGWQSIAYGYDPAGNQTSEAATNADSKVHTVIYGYDDAGRLSNLSTDFGQTATDLTYDGRSFLRRSFKAFNGLSDFEIAEPVYSSGGVLVSRRYQRQTSTRGPIVLDKTSDVFYFAGRPVSLRVEEVGSPGELYFVVGDHLDAPALVTDEAGSVHWSGGFRAFGDAHNLVSNTEVFLRFPGQWTDPSFSFYPFRGDLYQNVHRWYETGLGAYSRPDPLGLLGSHLDLYGYAHRTPSKLIDPLGLRTCVVVSWTYAAGLGGVGLFVGDHTGLYVDRECKGDCAFDGPFIYDPSGSYQYARLGGRAGSGQIISPLTPGWDFDDYTDFQCTKEQSFVEVFCFDTSCCEERAILDNAVDLGGGGFASCAANVSRSINGVGPFPSDLITGVPKRLRQALNRLIRKQQSPATVERRDCSTQAQ